MIARTVGAVLTGVVVAGCGWWTTLRGTDKEFDATIYHLNPEYDERGQGSGSRRTLRGA